MIHFSLGKPDAVARDRLRHDGDGCIARGSSTFIEEPFVISDSRSNTLSGNQRFHLFPRAMDPAQEIKQVPRHLRRLLNWRH